MKRFLLLVGLLVGYIFVFSASSSSSLAVVKDTTANKFGVPCDGYKYIFKKRIGKQNLYYKTNYFTYVGRNDGCIVFRDKDLDTSIITLCYSSDRFEIDSCK